MALIAIFISSFQLSTVRTQTDDYVHRNIFVFIIILDDIFISHQNTLTKKKFKTNYHSIATDLLFKAAMLMEMAWIQSQRASASSACNTPELRLSMATSSKAFGL